MSVWDFFNEANKDPMQEQTRRDTPLWSLPSLCPHGDRWACQGVVCRPRSPQQDQGYDLEYTYPGLSERTPEVLVSTLCSCLYVGWTYEIHSGCLLVSVIPSNIRSNEDGINTAINFQHAAVIRKRLFRMSCLWLSVAMVLRNPCHLIMLQSSVQAIATFHQQDDEHWRAKKSATLEM